MYFHELLAWIPLQMITIIHSIINVKMLSLRNGEKSGKSYLHFLLQMISPALSLCTMLELLTTLYNIMTENATYEPA
jgi:hypothetical protein